MTAFRVELFSAELVDLVHNSSVNRDLPLQLCFYINDGDNIYGDRICNNAMGGAILSILVATALLMVEMQVPCVTSNIKVCLTNVVAIAYWYVCSYIQYIYLWKDLHMQLHS